MGQGDPKQRKLTFDKMDESERSSSTSRQQDAEGAANSLTGMDGTATIMAELQAGLHAMDNRLDTITSRLDRMGERLDNHRTRLGKAEQRISDHEDHSCELTR